MLALGMLAAGCGGDASTTATTATRAAAGAGAGSCDPSRERRSTARSLAVRNLLPVRVSVGMYDVNCAQWSGVSTPYAWDGTVIAPGRTETRRMEMAKGTSPAWTMELPIGRVEGAPFRITCRNPDNPCGYGVLGAPAGPWPDSVVVSTDAQPSWAATDAQRASLQRMAVNEVAI